MESKDIPQVISDLTVEEKEAVLRALGFYQIHLFDEMKSEPDPSQKIESHRVTLAIKKIHKSIETQKSLD